ncbi:formimidoylglutamase [Olivibacter sitiensis]|uniref:formimidoylglutamase n=1 Tax=Olivibacter sitiensis TaxID=376470 RepID=UPI000411A248|nr:formimidoylglutamase [Olivibacter sitiensis]
MSLIDFFAPVDLQKLTPSSGFFTSQLGSHILIHSDMFPNHEEESFDLALFGVLDDRRAVGNQGCALAPDYIRERLYALHKGDYKIKMADLGNIKAGETVADTYAAVKTVVAELLKKNIVPIILGGGQDLTYPQYAAYEELEQRVDLVVIDSHFDLDDDIDEQLENTSHTFLSKILLHQPNYLFNYSNVGYQTYYTSQDSLRVMEKLYFDAYRLGLFANGKIDQSEPVIRNADLLSFDVSAIRSSDALANANATPNGFYGEQACQICRYAGMSDKLSSIGFYEMNPAYDQNGQTATLLSQMIWYFIDGYYNRKKDFPLQPKTSYIIYRAALSENEHELVFVKSKKSDRWWMQVPYPNTKSANERFHMVPCRYEDYQMAVDGEMPDLWWRTYQKLV